MSVNQKQMGAYYTENDISDYIAKNAIIPFLFKAVEKKHPAHFEPLGSIWRLLRENPDHYIYKAVRCEHYLPTETEREHLARRERYREIKARLHAGEITSINDLVTFNLDIGRFAQDVIEHCAEPDLLQTFFESLKQMTILDPTCGTGAFLFAALNVLEPLYEGCLDRLDQGNRRNFILKSIICNNLYGVDFMHEAVEICKSQLYLKLLAEIKDGVNEPFTEIDDNIRVGNALVGFVTHQDRSLTRTQLDQFLAREYGIDPQDAPAFEQWRSSHRPFHWCIEFDNIMQRGGFDVIIGNPPYAEYTSVKSQYTIPSGMYETETCGNLYAFCMERFAALSNSTSTSGLIVPLSIICTSRMAPVRRMLYKAHSHLWFNNYDTIPCTLFSGTVQRHSIVLSSKDRILNCLDQSQSCHPERSEGSPSPSRDTLGCTPDDKILPMLLLNIQHHTPTDQRIRDVYTTRNQKWYASERTSLFESVSYLPIGPLSPLDVVPKVSTELALNILNKILTQQFPITSYLQQHSNNTLVYKRRWSYFLLFADTIEGIMLPNGSIRQQKDVKILALQPHLDRYIFIALLSSSLFYFHYSVFSDFRHVNMSDFERFMFDYRKLSTAVASKLSALSYRLMQSYWDNLQWRMCNYVGSIGECRVPFYKQGASKSITDAIDAVLAELYDLTEEELDFIINYDGKYRLGENHVS